MLSENIYSDPVSVFSGKSEHLHVDKHPADN